MKRFSLLTLAIVLPTILAIVFAVYRHRMIDRRDETLRMIETRIESNRNLSLFRLTKYFVQSEVVAILDHLASDKRFTYDGASRFVQVQPAGLRYEEGTIDMLYLHDITDGSHCAGYQPPIGTVIDSVVFAGDGIDVTIHGDLLIQDEIVSVPPDAPETYHMPWPRGDPTASRSLNMLIRNRQR